jgi:hypothetical protein
LRKKFKQIGLSVLGNTNQVATFFDGMAHFILMSFDDLRVMPLRIQKWGKIVDGGDGFGRNGWWLSPVGSVKNVAFANKKFDG